MKGLGCRRYALWTSIATAFLAACGGSQPPIGAPGAMPQSRAIATNAERGGSWMLPEATSEDLLYVLGGCGGTCVLSYPKGSLVGALDEPQYGIQSTCSDKHGDVFLSNNTTVLEYAHGGTSPIATLQLPGDSANGCSIDPKTGNLAVVFKTNGADLAIFQNAQGSPSLYDSQIDSLYCGYDGVGNLFVDGYYGNGPGLSELPVNRSAFSILSFTSEVGAPRQVQWDGTHITYQSSQKGAAKILQLAINGSSATVIGTTNLKQIKNAAAPSWIYGTKIIAPYSNRAQRTRLVGIWKYPGGGAPTKTFKEFGNYPKPPNFQGVTLSVATSQ